MYTISKSDFHVTIECGDVSVKTQVINPSKVAMLQRLVDAANRAEALGEALKTQQRILHDVELHAGHGVGAMEDCAKCQAILENEETK